MSRKTIDTSFVISLQWEDTDGKTELKRGNDLPLPAVVVVPEVGRRIYLTVAWTGTICTNPAMLYIQCVRNVIHVHDQRIRRVCCQSYYTEELAKATDYCGVRSGRMWINGRDALDGERQKNSVRADYRECPVNIGM